ncbi:hypothetical protein DSM112329_03439 [Paraconexibacter sp. AEG42_29]|uniref:Flippase-like domain-containing protein n=1 Tax=Paraconexibacter sp. AEG42_29 TaxID=2997339 RepID=A0AAU7AXX1_9ACTN
MTGDTAPPQVDEQRSAADDDLDEAMPKMQMTRDRALLLGLFIVSVIAFLYFVLPELSDVNAGLGNLKDADPVWIALALVFQILAMASYVMIFQGIHVPPNSVITYRESYLITMAGLAATRLFAAGGAGGVALTAWALRRSGMPRREVAERMIAFLVLLYGVYMAALLVGGLGLYFHVFPGEDSFALTLVPAILAAVAILIMLAIGLVPDDLERRLDSYKPKNAQVAAFVRRLATGPASLSGGVRFALQSLRRPDLAMVGTISWWAFNILVLYAAFQAVGEAPTVAALVMGYFIGLLGNLLPLPGGVGGVDAGMVGAFIAFGVDESTAFQGVLIYRVFAFWLPSIPGAIAYFQLRHTVNRWKEQRLAEKALQPAV